MTKALPLQGVLHASKNKEECRRGRKEKENPGRLKTLGDGTKQPLKCILDYYVESQFSDTVE